MFFGLLRAHSIRVTRLPDLGRMLETAATDMCALKPVHISMCAVDPLLKMLKLQTFNRFCRYVMNHHKSLLCLNIPKSNVPSHWKRCLETQETDKLIAGDPQTIRVEPHVASFC